MGFWSSGQGRLCFGVVVEKEVGLSKGTRSQIEYRTSVSEPKQDVRVKEWNANVLRCKEREDDDSRERLRAMYEAAGGKGNKQGAHGEGRRDTVDAVLLRTAIKLAST